MLRVLCSYSQTAPGAGVVISKASSLTGLTTELGRVQQPAAKPVGASQTSLSRSLHMVSKGHWAPSLGAEGFQSQCPKRNRQKSCTLPCGHLLRQVQRPSKFKGRGLECQTICRWTCIKTTTASLWETNTLIQSV